MIIVSILEHIVNVTSSLWFKAEPLQILKAKDDKIVQVVIQLTLFIKTLNIEIGIPQTIRDNTHFQRLLFSLQLL